MAKKKSEPHKGAAAKELLEQNPKMTIKEVREALAQRGIKISANYVYMLKSKKKDKLRKAKREKALAVTNSAGVIDPLALVRETKALAARLGGLRKLRELVDVLSE